MIFFIQTTQARRNGKPGFRTYPFITKDYNSVSELIDGLRDKGVILGHEIIYEPDHKAKVKRVLRLKPVALRQEGYSAIEESWGKFVDQNGQDVT